jgi:cell division protein FtsB
LAKFSFLAPLEKREQNAKNVVKNLNYSSKLEDEIALLRSEVDILKRALRNKIARHEISMIKKGADVESIID